MVNALNNNDMIPHLYYGCTENLHEARNQAKGALEAIEISVKEIGQAATAEGMGVKAGAMPFILDAFKVAVERLEMLNKYFDENQEPDHEERSEPTAEEMEAEDRRMQESIDSSIADKEIQQEILESMNPEPENDGQPDESKEWEDFEGEELP